MAFSVNTNSSALEALRQLVGTNRSLEITQSRINTGLDVRTAADDPANFSIAQNLRGQVRGFEAVRSSLDRATSTVDIAIAAAETISDLLIDMRETTIAAADSGIDSQSRQALSDEFSRLLEQVNSVVSQANFNGTNIVDPSLTRITALTGTEVAVNDINADGIVDAGEAKLSNIIEINGRDLTTNGLGIAINNFEIDPALGYDVNINDLSAVAQNLDDRDFVNAWWLQAMPIISSTPRPIRRALIFRASPFLFPQHREIPSAWVARTSRYRQEPLRRNWKPIFQSQRQRLLPLPLHRRIISAPMSGPNRRWWMLIMRFSK